MRKSGFSNGVVLIPFLLAVFSFAAAASLPGQGEKIVRTGCAGSARDGCWVIEAL